MKLYFETVHSLHDKIVNKEIKAAEVAQAVVSRLEETEGKVGAYLDVESEKALNAAKKTDEKIAKGEEIGFLEGIPGAIKDNICTKGVKTTCASKILENFVMQIMIQ